MSTASEPRTELPESADVVVVGAGIVGLATAVELLRRGPDRRVVVLEQEHAVGRHQTGNNSGVVHAGLYYAPGSLKARLCRDGVRRLVDYCERSEIEVRQCGKLIVAVDDVEVDRLRELERRANANQVPGVRWLQSEELGEVEPHVRGRAGLWSPSTAIVDFGAVARSLAADLRRAGGQIVLGCRVEGSRRQHGGLTISTDRGQIVTSKAVFCAGAWADRLAVRSGGDADPRVVPFRGAYLRLRPQAQHLVRGLIYPVPDPRLPFLGVHLTRTVADEVLLGPTALPALGRGGRGLHWRDGWETVAWRGSWRVARSWWRTGIDEMRMRACRQAFVAACARYVPEIGVDDVESAWAGVRAQAVSRDGRLVDDFVIDVLDDRQIHVRNAPSPAATSSMAIAAFVADDADRAFGDY